MDRSFPNSPAEEPCVFIFKVDSSFLPPERSLSPAGQSPRQSQQGHGLPPLGADPAPRSSPGSLRSTAAARTARGRPGSIASRHQGVGVLGSRLPSVSPAPPTSWAASTSLKLSPVACELEITVVLSRSCFCEGERRLCK